MNTPDLPIQTTALNARYPLLSSFLLDETATLTQDTIAKAWEMFFASLYGGELSGKPFTIQAPGDSLPAEFAFFMDGWGAGVFLTAEENGDRLLSMRRNLATARRSIRSEWAKNRPQTVPEAIRSIAIAGPPLPGRHRVFIAYTEWEGRTDYIGWDSDSDIESVPGGEASKVFGQNVFRCIASVYYRNGKPTDSAAVMGDDTGGWGFFGPLRIEKADIPNVRPVNPFTQAYEEVRESAVGRAYIAALEVMEQALDSDGPSALRQYRQLLAEQGDRLP